MNVWEHVRKTLFGVSQAEFAGLLNVHQSTVSRWERDDLTPSVEELATIRKLARGRGIEWSDEWLFETLQKQLVNGGPAQPAPPDKRPGKAA